MTELLEADPRFLAYYLHQANEIDIAHITNKAANILHGQPFLEAFLNHTKAYGMLAGESNSSLSPIVLAGNLKDELPFKGCMRLSLDYDIYPEEVRVRYSSIRLEVATGTALTLPADGCGGTGSETLLNLQSVYERTLYYRYLKPDQDGRILFVKFPDRLYLLDASTAWLMKFAADFTAKFTT